MESNSHNVQESLRGVVGGFQFRVCQDFVESLLRPSEIGFLSFGRAETGLAYQRAGYEIRRHRTPGRLNLDGDRLKLGPGKIEIAGVEICRSDLIVPVSTLYVDRVCRQGNRDVLSLRAIGEHQILGLNPLLDRRGIGRKYF